VINTTDPDSHNMQTADGCVQGYNAQATVNEQGIVIAAEVMVRSPDFGYLDPIVTATDGRHFHLPPSRGQRQRPAPPSARGCTYRRGCAGKVMR
jgi:hypothetical protein